MINNEIQLSDERQDSAHAAREGECNLKCVNSRILI